MDLLEATPQVDIDSTLRVILSDAIEALEGSAGVVASWNESGRRFVITHSQGLTPRALERLRPLLDEALPDLARSKRSFDLLSDLRANPLLPYSECGSPLNPFMVLPLQVGSKSVGLICVLRRQESAAFTGVDQPILDAFARQAAVAVYNAGIAQVLSEEKRKIETMFEGSAEGIISIDSQRRVVGLNKAMEKLIGHSREDIVGRPCHEVLELRDWQGESLCYSRCPMLRRPEKISTYETQGTIRTADGQDVDVAMVYSMAPSPSGHPSAVINIRDITRLREVERLRSTFLSMLGHELRTPLSLIKGYASTLSMGDGKLSQGAMRESLGVIEEECDRLTKLVNRLLLASQLESGMPVLHKEHVHLSSIAARVLRKIEPMAAGHNLVSDFSEGFPVLYLDPDLMEEVLTNLVENAVKYSPEGGRILVCGKVDRDIVEVSVSDEGIGVPLREMEQIFERFQRGDNKVVRRVRGMGLGLYICRYIVEAHGGSIHVTSQVGVGSKFTISLPLACSVMTEKDG